MKGTNLTDALANHSWSAAVAILAGGVAELARVRMACKKLNSGKFSYHQFSMTNHERLFACVALCDN
jgi:hypothetical protein